MLNVMFARSKACNAPPLSIVLTRRLQHPKNCLAPSRQSSAHEKRPRLAHAAPSSVCGYRWRRADWSGARHLLHSSECSGLLPDPLSSPLRTSSLPPSRRAAVADGLTHPALISIIDTYHGAQIHEVQERKHLLDGKEASRSPAKGISGSG